MQQLFSDLARLEHRSEDARLALARIYDFHPRNAFQRIDRFRNYSLDVFELKDFLRDQGKYVSSQEVELLIAAHDASGDKRLNNREFESLVLPQTDPRAREHTFTRREVYVGRYDHLPREIESALADLMYNEIQALRRLEDDKSALKRRYDFSRFEAFKSLDKYNSGSVLRADLIEFVKRNGGYATYHDSEAVFRRLDKDSDGRLNYSEVCDFLDSRPSPVGTSASRNSSPLRSSQGDWRSKSVGVSRPQTSTLNSSPLRQTLAQTAEKKQSEPREDLGASADKSTAYGSPSPVKQEEGKPEEELQPRKLDMDELEASPEQEEQAEEKPEEAENKGEDVEASQEQVKEEESKAEAPAQEAPEQQRSRGPGLTSSEEFDLFWALKQFAQLENESERAKQDLALRYDFNLFDAFRVIDGANKGEIYRFELSDSLKKHGILADRSEIELLYSRFDRNKDGKLRFSEFADAITPLDRTAAHALNRRQSNYRDPRPFSALTMGMFEDTLRKILRNLGQENDMNRRLREKPAFFISGAFERLDVNGNGFISKDELQRFFDAHRHFATSRELDLLIARFDNDHDGRVSYGEFFRALQSV